MIEALEAIPPAMGYISIGVLIGITISELHDLYFERRQRKQIDASLMKALLAPRTERTRSTDQ